MMHRLTSLCTLFVLTFTLLHQSVGIAFIGSPSIQLAPAGTLEKDKPYTIKAKVQDDYGIDKVMLHYRAIGKRQFSSRTMIQQNPQSDIYTITLETSDIPEPGIQYYVRAISMTGAISAMPDQRQSTVEVVYLHLLDEKKKTRETKWLWIGLGALALGALAAGGGGGGGSGSGLTDDPTADVTITTSLPPSSR